MRIAYATTDDVNHALAARLAGPFGATVTPFHPEHVRPRGRFDAVLYDLDRVPPDRRPGLLEEILSGAPACPKAVHGYSLTEEQAAATRLRGVAVAQRLHPDLVHTLCRAALRDLTAVPPDDALTDPTWINLTD
jgi:hypothetical protein